ncbi:MAG TPA: rhodanese-like domain-containing protein [Steroidobacteraceae bacterium]|nr:rhodanese-like domain-containing protein [Steroidobacteraceae bacterium]
MPSSVIETAPADSAAALEHFASAFRFETDCWDVHDAISNGRQDFTLLDVRSPDLYANGHAPGAVNIPHRKLIESTLNRYPRETIFVVYCAGPHCNGAHRAAVRLARLGRPVKIMIGGMTGWLDEGFTTASGPTACAALSG